MEKIFCIVLGCCRTKQDMRKETLSTNFAVSAQCRVWLLPMETRLFLWPFWLEAVQGRTVAVSCRQWSVFLADFTLPCSVHRNADSQLFDKVRGHDIKLLRYLSVRYICDLMVENKKVKFGLKWVWIHLFSTGFELQLAALTGELLRGMYSAS